jgi:hypothetical protein
VSVKLYPLLKKLQEALAARLQTMFTELDIQMDKVVQDYVNAFGRVPQIPRRVFMGQGQLVRRIQSTGFIATDLMSATRTATASGVRALSAFCVRVAE